MFLNLTKIVLDNKFIEALQLGFEMFEDPGKSLVGLRGSTDRKRAHITLRLLGILKKFLDLSLTKNFPEEGGMATLTKYFNDIVPPCISICIKLNKAGTHYVWDIGEEGGGSNIGRESIKNKRKTEFCIIHNLPLKRRSFSLTGYGTLSSRTRSPAPCSWRTWNPIYSATS